MREDHFIVIGNGPAGSQAAFTLKEKAPEARVTIVTKEREGCCHSHLLPGFLAGSISEKKVFAISLDHYTKSGIKLRTGQSVVDVNPQRKEILLEHKETISYSGLIIAVGGRPYIPEPLLAYREHLCTLKTFQDTGTWRQLLPAADSILIMGGDLTSLAVTKSLLALKKKIYFMLTGEAFWPLRFDKALQEEVSGKLTKRGVTVLAGNKLVGIEPVRSGSCRVYVDGQKIKVDMIGAFFGLVPDIGFLRRSGLQLDRGVLVDEYLCSSHEGICAAGDCAQIYHPEIKDYWVSIGTKNARSLGKIAAVNLAGGRKKTRVDRERIFDIQGVKVNTSWWMEF